MAHENIVNYLKENAEKYSAKVAVSQRDESYTYNELWDCVIKVCDHLIRHDVSKGDRIAILLDNSFEYIAIYYGVLLSGAVVVPLNSSAKADDLTNWIQHSGSSWLFISQSNKELSDIQITLGNTIKYVLSEEICNDNNEHQLHADAYLNNILKKDVYDPYRGIDICQTDVATIIYTSGTTGKPKGVTLTHGNLLCNMQSILKYLPIMSTDRCLDVLPFYYSYGNSIMHTHLMSGATLILENSFLFPHVIMKKIQDEKVTSFSGVPSIYALLINRTKLQEYDLSNMRYMTQAGGAMLPAHIEKIRLLLPSVDFFVMYGQTEATARLSYLPSFQVDKKMSSIGIAIPDVTLELRDEHGKPVKPGETGEIYANGPNIMRGYWNDNAMTQSVLSDGWLKTGDLGKQDEDGYFYIVGRKTEMIKSGAHRISPLDIEEAILRCVGVAEVAVIGQSDELLGQTIKAYVVTKPEVELTKRDVMAHCKKYLATYKLPKEIVFISELPKTASGKIKRFELH